MKTVGHPIRHDDNGDGPGGDVVCIDNLALAYCFYTPQRLKGAWYDEYLAIPSTLARTRNGLFDFINRKT